MAPTPVWRRTPRFGGAWRLGVAALLFAVAACSGAVSPDRGDARPGQAAIASPHPLATRAGQEVLEAGGNAFDAAVAVSAALAVVEPFGSGIGGGGFFLLHRAEDGHQVMVDARETAPGEATRDMYLDDDGQPIPRLSQDGALAAGIPGLPAALVHISERYGRLPLADVLAPAIRHAEDGFEAYERMILGLRFKEDLMRESDAVSAVFFPEGRMPEPGDLIRQTDLAQTLRTLARDGHDGFYRGPLAETLVEGVRAKGGIWSLEDFAEYRVIERAPDVIEYGDARIVAASLPSSGGVVLSIVLNILDGFDLDALSEPERHHLVIEAMRRGYRDRALYLGDPDFTDIPHARLTHPLYAAGLRAAIRRDRAMPSDLLPGIAAGDESPQTTHFSVIDADGNRVATTQTLNFWYGAGVMAPGTGVMLNNEMDDFSTKPGVPDGFDLVTAEANAIEPGKRMLSSMTPTFVESPRGVAILGTPGGSRIITMVLLGTLAFLEGRDADEIVAMRRYHHQYLPDRISHERGAFSDELASALEAKGHELAESGRDFGNLQLVIWEYDGNRVSAASDPRNESGDAQVY